MPIISIAVAFRAFFKALFDRDVSNRISTALDGDTTPQKAIAEKKESSEPKSRPEKPIAPAKPQRSDAIALLELLQREARFVDFMMESLDEYSDEQVGVAVRDVHRGSRELIDRIFSLEPIVTDEEGSEIEVPKDYSASSFRVVGNVSGDPPYQGELLHHGWQAKQVKLPKWSGKDDGLLVVAPVEVEVKS